MKNRIYIKNLPYNTLEEELEDYLEDYKPTTVLIPSYTIRLTKSHRYLGIAYAEFADEETLFRAVRDLDGKRFKGRNLVVLIHNPGYLSRNGSLARKNSKSTKVPEFNDIAANIPSVFNNEEDAHDSNAESITNTDELRPFKLDGSEQSVSIPTSFPTVGEPIFAIEKGLVDIETFATTKNTIYIKKVPSYISAADLQLFFKDYSPKVIYLYLGISRLPFYIKPYFSVLISVAATDISVSDIVNNLTGSKVKDHKLQLQVSREGQIVKMIEYFGSKVGQITELEEVFTEINTAEAIAESKSNKETDQETDQETRIESDQEVPVEATDAEAQNVNVEQAIVDEVIKNSTQEEDVDEVANDEEAHIEDVADHAEAHVAEATSNEERKVEVTAEGIKTQRD